ncbi:MAG: signal recognition particle protein [Synergistales bacterium]|nr:signal recognition particle protein [Synergistales bacterium]
MFDVLKERLDGIFKNLRGKGKLTEEDVAVALREVRRALLEADVNYKVVKDLVERIRERAVGRDVLESITPSQQVVTIVFEELRDLMGRDVVPLVIASRPPTSYMMVGLQGSGKTTSCVKIARRFLKGHKPLVVACDHQRPAAVEQLRVLADQAKVAFFGPEPGEKDPIGVARKALRFAEDRLHDVILFDTAGRLHVDEPLMAELEAMKSLVEPEEILLVVDSMTGQEAVNVASAFNERLTLTGLVLTKLDGDARGGAALAVRSVTGVPIKMAGVGEHLEDMEPFDAGRMVQRILGMGDIQGLMERVQLTADDGEMEKMAESLKKSRFTMEDLLTQIRQVKKMGPLDKVMEMLPLPENMKQLRGAEMDPKRLRHVEAVILSMTPAERRNPEIIKGSRRRRIADGSGTTVQMVNQVLKQHGQMKELWKRFGKSGKKGFKLPKLF